MKKLCEVYKRHREALSYLIAGGLTTAINYAVYLLCAWLLGGHRHSTVPATGIAWLVAVLFAYAVNRAWVFRSTARGFGPVCRELAAFVAARIFSGLLDVGIMYVMVDRLGLPDKIIKLVSNALVIVLNYIFSKLFIFTNNRRQS